MSLRGATQIAEELRAEAQAERDVPRRLTAATGVYTLVGLPVGIKLARPAAPDTYTKDELLRLLTNAVDAKAARDALAEQAPDCALLALTADEMLAPIPPTPYLIGGLVPCEAYTILAGALSAGKTTFGLALKIWRCTGFDILNLDRDGRICVEPGPGVFITYEDSDRIIAGRFLRIVQWAHQGILEVHGARAARSFLELLAKNFRRITLTGEPGTQLIVRDINGQPRRNEAQLEKLVSTIGTFADREVLLTIDPLRLAFTGSQNDDHGADLGVHTLNWLACAYPDSAVVALSHATKNQAVEQSDDRMALAYGTSGSALWSQHARSNFHAGRPKADELRRLAPGFLTDEEIEKRRVTTITHARLSYGAEADTAYYAMRNGVLVPIPRAQAESVMDRLRRWFPLLADAIRAIEVDGGRATQVALEADSALRIKVGGRNELRDAIKQSLAQGWLEQHGTTSDRRLGITDAGQLLSPIRAGAVAREAER